MNNVIVKGLLFVICMSIVSIADAQKLPLIQKNHQRAPKNIKPDGKATEWNNKFEAYNKATEVFYTVSNDDKRLYLTLQADKRVIVNKIINGGITFSIVKGEKKTTEGAAAVTYPVFNMADKPYLNFKGVEELANDKTATPAQTDSLMQANNKAMEQKAKFLKVTGIAGVDTLISVYNTEGISLRSGFDQKMVYTYELAIDLKLLGLDVKTATPFKYNIRLNAIQPDFIPGIEITRGADGRITSMNVFDSRAARAFSPSLSATDCWGDYTLAR